MLELAVAFSPAIASLAAAGASIYYYVDDDVLRAIYWLLIAALTGRWFMSNLEYWMRKKD